jgi:hypothetical protein
MQMRIKALLLYELLQIVILKHYSIMTEHIIDAGVQRMLIQHIQQ